MSTSEIEDSIGLELASAIRAGDLHEVNRLLESNPAMAAAQIRVLGWRTPLMVVSDWPGYFPNGPEMVRVLIAAGADPNGTSSRDGTAHETALHWAASSDDVAVAVALIDGGADIEAPGSSIAGGAPLENAVGYGCWHVARLLVERGARVEKLWQAAALGLSEQVEFFLSAEPSPSADEITEAFWQACHGGQRRAAERLLAKGADINGHPPYTDQSALDAAGSPDTRRSTMVEWLISESAESSQR